MKKPALQHYRMLAQMGFFALFTLTPLFDLPRYDLTEKHAYFLTYQWHVGIDDLIAGQVDAQTATVNLIKYLFIPILGTGTAAHCMEMGSLYSRLLALPAFLGG